ncbi:ATP-binding protein [bacterium]|nr:ATP-binding protein [bacterium]
MIKRDISTNILSAFKQYPIVSITGPRQSGKTTLVKNLFPDIPYVNLESPDIRIYANEDPRGFLSDFPESVILDEVQRSPQLFSYIQAFSDDKNKSSQFILTGSHNFLLMENITQSLAGRVAIFKLMPFSMHELKSAKLLNRQSDAHIYTGFYPKLYDQNFSVYEYYQNYIQTYIERDVRQIKNITDLNTFQRFLKMCAARTGQILNLSSLANDCGVTHNTIKAWLSILQTSYIVHLLYPHHNNFSKRLIKMPKLYFLDPGLVCALINIETKDQIKTHYLRGELFETMIVSEFLKYRFNLGREPNCYFWRDKMGREIDLIVDKAGASIPVEIKSGKTITEDYFKNIRYYCSLAKMDTASAFLIYNGSENQMRNTGHVIGWNLLGQRMDDIFL